MGFLMLIPGIFTLFDRVLGPMLSGSSGALGAVTKVLTGGDATGSSIISAVEGIIGGIDATKKQELINELDSMLANVEVDKLETSPNSKFTPRVAFEWALGTIVCVHFAFGEALNIWNVCHGMGFAPIDNMTLIFLGGLLGIYATTKTVEKMTANQDE